MLSVAFSELVRNYALVVAAIIGVLIGLWRASAADRQARAQSAQVAQGKREHATELFARATERLDHDKLHMRYGAILTLQGITENYPEMSRATVDLLSAYLKSADYSDDRPPLDVVKIMELIVPREED